MHLLILEFAFRLVLGFILVLSVLLGRSSVLLGELEESLILNN